MEARAMIVRQLLIGMLAIAATVVIHAAFMAVAGRVRRRAPSSPIGPLRQAGTIVAVVLWFFLSLCLQCWVWAALLLRLGALGSLEEALYFATVSFTTLGYGDILLGPEWRLLGAVAAANGTIIIGWTTAMVFLAVQEIYRARG
jgi:hypothetical protein